MVDFTIHIDTVETRGASEDVLDKAAMMLEEGGALDPVMALDVESGVFSATFQVEAANLKEATQRGIDLFADPLLILGVHTREQSEGELGGTVSAHKCAAEDLVESVTTRHTRDLVAA